MKTKIMKQQKYYKRDINEVYENSEAFPEGLSSRASQRRQPLSWVLKDM